MDKILRAFDFVVGLHFTFGMYPVSQLKALGRFKSGGLKLFARKGGKEGKMRWGCLEMRGCDII